MKELVIATGNRNKFRELQHLLCDVVEQLLSLEDFPGFEPGEEDGGSFAENAIKKAKTAAMFTGKPAIADDSGLAVDALGGNPGIFSARYAGEGASDTANNAMLLNELKVTSPEYRTAAFHCAIAYCSPDGACRTFAGRLDGLILSEPQGTGGFGYDPLFLVPQFNRTLAEITLDIKNKISHRAVALAKLKEYLANL